MANVGLGPLEAWLVSAPERGLGKPVLKRAEVAPPVDLPEGRDVIVINACPFPSLGDRVDRFLPRSLLRLLKFALLFAVGRRDSVNGDEHRRRDEHRAENWANEDAGVASAR